MTRANNSQDPKDVWQTPDELLDNIHEEIDLDPCAGEDTSIGETNYTRKDDGLEQEWHGTVFVNPPFSKKKQFIKKTIEELDEGRVETAYVVTPDSTDVQSWWHGMIAPNADYIWFSEGRISYISPETGEPAPFPTFGTAVSIYGEPAQETLQAFTKSGQLMETVENP